MIGGDVVLRLFPQIFAPSMNLSLTINPHQNTETLLVNGSEALASRNSITCRLAFELNVNLITLLF